MLTYSTLDFGNPKDALSWEAGCNKLGFNAITSIMEKSPSLERLKEFFKGQPDWVYFSGHFAGMMLWGDGASVEFKKESVALTAGDANTELTKSASQFRLHETCTLVIWGGCGACSSAADIKLMRELFKNPTILGYSGMTGWAINDAMLGGGFIRPHFFNNLTVGDYSSENIVKA